MATRVEAIGSSTNEAAESSRARLREQYNIYREQILRRADYLRQVAEGLRMTQIQNARNAEFFAQVAQRSVKPR